MSRAHIVTWQVNDHVTRYTQHIYACIYYIVYICIYLYIYGRKHNINIKIYIIVEEFL